MARILSLVALSAVVGASIIQQPLQDNSGQAVINNKHLVSSEALESHITYENLLERAKQLYKIAELGAEEYNHPTRVIGSKGRFQSKNAHSGIHCTKASVAQDTLLPSTTSILTLRISATTMSFRIKPSMPLWAISSNPDLSSVTVNLNRPLQCP
jgi:hypothetical protein